MESVCYTNSCIHILDITPLQYSRYSNELIIIFPSVAQIYPMQGAANLDIF